MRFLILSPRFPKVRLSELVVHADFLEVISAIGIEDLFTNGNKIQPQSHAIEVLGHLIKVAAAKNPALLIEYPKSAERRAASKKLALENALVWLVTDRQLRTIAESGK